MGSMTTRHVDGNAPYDDGDGQQYNGRHNDGTGGTATGGTMTARAAGQQGNRQYNDNNGRHDDAA